MNKYLSQLAVGYKLLILGGGGILAIGFVIIFSIWALNGQKADGLVINVAGRQRMLAQKFTKEYFDESSRDLPQEERAYPKTRQLFEMSLKALKDGGSTFLDLDMNPESEVLLPETKKEGIRQQLEKVEALWGELQTAVEADDLDTIRVKNVETLKNMHKAVDLLQKHTEKKIWNSIIVAVIVGLLGASLGFLFGWLISRNVTVRLAEITGAAELVAAGDVTGEIGVTGRDEIGVLADSFRELVAAQKAKTEVAGEIARGNLAVTFEPVSEKDSLGRAMVVMKDTITTMSADLNKVIDAQKAGELNARCRPDELQGAWADLLGGVNDALDAVIHPVFEGIEILGEYSKGNLRRKMHDLPGEQIMLTNGLNGIHDNLTTLVSNLQETIDAQKEGDLDARCRPEAFQGAYARLLQGVNEALDAVIHPIFEGMEILNEYSGGDLEQEMRMLPGKQVLMTEGLNGIRTNLMSLVSELRTIIDAQKEGALDARCDPDKFQGAYGELVGGINDALSAVISPVFEGIEILREYAGGNLQREMRPLPGKQILLTEGLNGIRTNLTNLVADLQTTIEAQKKGDLDTRCRPETFQGAYAKLLAGVNQALDAVILPILEGIEILGDYSRGDLDREMRGLPGKQILLTEGLNTIRTNLRTLIAEGVNLAHKAREGQLRTRGDVNRFEGGYRDIIHGINQVVEAIVAPIEELRNRLGNISTGDLTAYVEGDYQGDYDHLKKALNSTLDALNGLLVQVKKATDQVDLSSRQISDSSQSLAQGATEQSAALEQISASITHLSAQSRHNADNAVQAKQLSDTSRLAAEEGNSQMQEMLAAMKAIDQAGQNISKIIKVIEEIAFQTNLLALNAAVEAARAGVHGKGFAVVAEEVRNLAARCAEAAHETTAMIQESVKSVQQGSDIADKTAGALDGIRNGVAQVADLVNEIAVAGDEQAQGIGQINKALDQLNQVTQQNSASSEESAAASSQLAAQARNLRHILTRFKLAAQKGSATAPAAISPQMMAAFRKFLERQGKPLTSALDKGYAGQLAPPSPDAGGAT